MIVLRLAAAVGLLVLVALLLDPTNSAAQSFALNDKVGHVIAFVAISLCIAILRPRQPLWATAALALSIGGATEIIQSFIGRSGSTLDFAADVMGVSLALLVISVKRIAWRDRP